MFILWQAIIILHYVHIPHAEIFSLLYFNSRLNTCSENLTLYLSNSCYCICMLLTYFPTTDYQCILFSYLH
jgi:hypothetical protein